VANAIGGNRTGCFRAALAVTGHSFMRPGRTRRCQSFSLESSGAQAPPERGTLPASLINGYPEKI
jgi:hypothetical protein